MLLGIVILVFSLSGCQTQEDPATEAPDPAETVQTAPETPDPVEDETEDPAGSDEDAAEEPPVLPVLDYYFMGSLYGMGDNPDIWELLEAPDALSRFKQFYGELQETVDRVEYHMQSLDYVGDYTGDIRFSANGTANGLGADGNLHTPLKTLMIGKAESDAFADVLESGRNFTEEDFTVESVSDAIPVILGQAYEGVYEIGDALTLSLHDQPLTYTVVGFLQENTTFHFNRDIPLDEYLVVPFYEIAYEPADAENEFYQELYYSQKCEGFVGIDSELDPEETFEAVRQLAEEYDLLYAVTPVKIKLSEALNVSYST
jgi:hypothetical protein